MLKNLGYTALLGIMISACGGTSEKSSNPEVSPKTSVTEDVAPANGEVNPMADFKFHKMIANLPSPMETFQILDSMEGEMPPVALTPTAKASKLSTMSQKSFGYGVYITDMGFLAYQKSNQETLNYLETCRSLAKELGAGEVFDRSIAQKFKESETDQAQFVNMMEEGFTAIDEYMQDNERFLNATEIFVGSWVESQLIAARMLKGKEPNDQNKKVYEGIYSQKMHASNLMNVLGEMDSDIEPKVYESVEDLMMFYAGFGSVESMTQEDIAMLEEKLVKLKKSLIG